MGSKSKELKRKEAAERNAAHAERSNDKQIAFLLRRQNGSAKKEMTKLLRIKRQEEVLEKAKNVGTGVIEVTTGYGKKQ